MQHQTKDAARCFTIGRGTNHFYICRQGLHFLKSVFDDINTEKEMQEVCQILNEHSQLCAVMDAARKYYANLHPANFRDIGEALDNLNTLRKSINQQEKR